MKGQGEHLGGHEPGDANGFASSTVWAGDRILGVPGAAMAIRKSPYCLELLHMRDSIFLC